MIGYRPSEYQSQGSHAKAESRKLKASGLVSFTSGTRLGPYEIVAPLGAGGPASARERLDVASYGASTEATERTWR